MNVDKVSKGHERSGELNLILMRIEMKVSYQETASDSFLVTLFHANHFSLIKNFQKKTTWDMIASIRSFEFVAFGSLSAVEDWLIAKISST